MLLSSESRIAISKFGGTYPVDILHHDSVICIPLPMTKSKELLFSHDSPFAIMHRHDTSGCCGSSYATLMLYRTSRTSPNAAKQRQLNTLQWRPSQSRIIISKRGGTCHTPQWSPSQSRIIISKRRGTCHTPQWRPSESRMIVSKRGGTCHTPQWRPSESRMIVSKRGGTCYTPQWRPSGCFT
jgi:hypothetical protein